MTWDVATILAGGIATLGIYSFLIKENGLYRFFEHLFIGIAAGFLPILTLQRFLWPHILVPMLGYDVVVFPDGAVVKPYSYWSMLYLVPLLFGLLYYTLYSQRFGWLAKVVIGFTLGYSAGLSFKGFFTEMMPQLISSFKPLLVANGSNGVDIFASFSNIVFVVTLLSVMWYFFFSVKMEGVISEKVTKGGRWLMMICFGAFFGSTVMARMALLVERMQFLAYDWFGALKGLLQ